MTTMQCRYGNTGRGDQTPCQRKARPGWTTCKAHASAGVRVEVYQRYLQDRQARPAQYRPDGETRLLDHLTSAHPSALYRPNLTGLQMAMAHALAHLPEELRYHVTTGEQS